MMDDDNGGETAATLAPKDFCRLGGMWPNMPQCHCQIKGALAIKKQAALSHYELVYATTNLNMGEVGRLHGLTTGHAATLGS